MVATADGRHGVYVIVAIADGICETADIFSMTKRQHQNRSAQKTFFEDNFFSSLIFFIVTSCTRYIYSNQCMVKN